MRYRAHRGSHFLSNCLLKCLVVNLRKKSYTKKNNFCPTITIHTYERNKHTPRSPFINHCTGKFHFVLWWGPLPNTTLVRGQFSAIHTHVLAKVRLNQCQIALIIIIAFISHFLWFWSDLLWFYCCLLAPVRMMIHDLPGGCWLLGIWSMCRG